MKNIICFLVLVLLPTLSCRQTGETRFIVLPFHTDSTAKEFNYLVANPPADSLQLLAELIAFYKKKVWNIIRISQ